MKKLFLSYIALFLCCVLTLSCGESENPISCENINGIAIESFEDLFFEDVTCFIQNINPDQGTVKLVIKTQSDFEKYFACNPMVPQIDFEKYFILAGRYRHRQCAIWDSQQVFSCKKRIIFKVNMLEQVCLAFTNVYYFTVLEKKYSNWPIEFDVRFIN
ncbi:hypothetical protein SAMN03080617_03435 [Algoriphagus alkaliphilus]|uniref:Lipoprotein n=1 Tax=Algoriphagus alkaliphilus TaxID=279824 RepID=A0A1G5ZB38_9BACT|nr:hypothetical protein [Algoriphagus alkaliphilus]SDA91735.1 hypothetical protein SAMN03080617_03435 [Algoriphagus alkaliphilus]